MNFSRTFAILFFSIFISFNSSLGQNGNSGPFKLDFTREAVLLGSGVAAGVTALLVISNLDPLTIEQIDALNPNDVNSFDRSFIGPLSEDRLGDVLLYGSYLLPLTFLAVDDTRKDFGDLALMYGEVLLLNASITGIVKGLSSRTRPYVYNEQSSLEEKTNIDARLSFYSGHTSNTASISFFTAKVFSEYITNKTTKIFIWSTAVLIPAVTGFSRINTYWHFPTDVIVGYIVGAAIGYLIPLIHKRENDESEQTNPAENFYKPIIGFQIKF
ncbi:MAG: phosphatase PAP2 family protein [Ignavibacteriaceae bacterium]